MGTSVPQLAPWKGLRPQIGAGVSWLQPCLAVPLSPKTPASAQLPSQQAVNPPSHVPSFTTGSAGFEQASIPQQDSGREGGLAPGTTGLCAVCERRFHKAFAQNVLLSGSAGQVSPAPGDRETGQFGAHMCSVSVLAWVFSSLGGCRQPELILFLPVKVIGERGDGCLSPCFHSWCPLVVTG